MSDLEIWPTSASLERPLESPIDALQQLVILDADWAQWEEPWGVDSLTVTPDRIIVENYPTRTEESKAMGLEEWFHPAIDEDAGHVWSITIKGNVKLRLLGSGVEGPVFADGVNYVISARTGKLLAIRAGIPEKLK